MSTCAECIHAELQCPPVIRCNQSGGFLYLDSPICEHFKSFDEDNDEKEEKE
jgi:hypothetical protein